MRIVMIVCTVLAALFAAAPASAEKRVALVIGNAAYKNVAKLTNPANDAKAVSGMLQSAGFDSVALHENLGIRELRRAINDFADAARDADTAVVYYSGHGVEVNGVNYLIPVDAVLDRDTDVPYETFSLENLVQVLEPARRLRLVMLDACRDNPFARTMKRTVGTRAIGRGLAAVEPASVNTFIGFAAKAGSFALDGGGANSPYAIALLNNLAQPGLDLRIAFGKVRDEVMKATSNKQEPFVYGSLGGGTISIIDSPGASVTVVNPPAAPTPVDRAAQAWGVIQHTTSVAVLEDYIKHFGSTVYGSMARARLEELKKSQVAVVSPPAALKPKTDEPARPAAPTSISGRWTWQAKCEDGSDWTGEFNFEQGADGTFSGTCRLHTGSGSCSSIKGQVSGNRMSFSVWWLDILGGHWNQYNFAVAAGGQSMRGTESSASMGVCTYQARR